MKSLILTVFLAASTASMSMVIAQDAALRTGGFTVTSSVLELVGEESARPFKEKIPIDEPITWEIYIPENYDSDRPAGVLVFINSRNSGEIESGWKAVMENTNLIYIGANGSGNEVDVPKRVAYAMLAPRVILNDRPIDQERIYVSGFSGGSRVASMVATEYNRLFKGAVYNSGANFWGEAALPRYREMVDNYYVFITGTEDFNLEDTREVYNIYQQMGIKNSKLIVVPGMKHQRPSAADFEAAIQHLDSRQSNPPQPE